MIGHWISGQIIQQIIQYLYFVLTSAATAVTTGLQILQNEHRMSPEKLQRLFYFGHCVQDQTISK